MSIWDTIESIRKKNGDDASIPFQKVLSSLDYIHEDNTVDLCFMCLLHLANENGFYLNDQSPEKGLQIVFKEIFLN